MKPPESPLRIKAPDRTSTAPVPKIVPEKVDESERLKTREPSSVIAPPKDPFVPPSPICSVAPREIEVVPMKPEELPVRTAVPPSILSEPAPEIAPDSVDASVRF